MTHSHTKLTEAQLALGCMGNGLEVNRSNMALVAFFNDEEFRNKVTRFYFDRAVGAING